MRRLVPQDGHFWMSKTISAKMKFLSYRKNACSNSMLANLKIVKQILASTKKDKLQNYFVQKVMDIRQLVSIWGTVCKLDVI